MAIKREKKLRKSVHQDLVGNRGLMLTEQSLTEAQFPEREGVKGNQQGLEMHPKPRDKDEPLPNEEEKATVNRSAEKFTWEKLWSSTVGNGPSAVILQEGGWEDEHLPPSPPTFPLLLEPLAH